MTLGRLLWVLVLATTVALPAGATEPMRQFDTPAQREDYKDLLGQLRCLVCQDQSLESSDAELAQDLRDQVYRLRVKEGRSNQATIDFLTDRYGDFVLYDPPLQGNTWALWLGPPVLLLVGIATAVVLTRKQRTTAELTADEHGRARALLDDPDDATSPDQEPPQ